MAPYYFRVIYFIILAVLSSLAQKWIWDIIYSLSDKKRKDVYEFGSEHQGRFRSRLFGWWLVESSSDRRKSRILIFICSILMVLPLMGTFLAFVSLFERALDKFVDYAAVALLAVTVLTFVIGIIYKHRNNVVSAKISEEISEYKSAVKKHFKKQNEIYERGRKGSKAQIYTFGFIKLFAVIALMIGLFFLILDPAKPKTAEEVTQSVSKYGIELVNLTSMYHVSWEDKNNQLETGMKGEKADISIEFFVFDSYDSSINILNQYAANIKRQADELDTEYKDQKTNYFVYTARVAGKYYVLSNIKNTLMCAQCDVENDELLLEIVRSAGYFDS